MVSVRTFQSNVIHSLSCSFYYLYSYLIFRISKVIESGIYEQWLLTTLRKDGFLQFFDDTVQDDFFKFERLKYRQVNDVFYVLFIGYTLSIVVFFWEFSYGYSINQL